MDPLAQFGDKIGALQQPLEDTLRKHSLVYVSWPCSGQSLWAGPLGGGPRLEMTVLQGSACPWPHSLLPEQPFPMPCP